jgi:3-dehydroquinate synthase
MAFSRLIHHTIGQETTAYYVGYSWRQLHELVPADRTVLLIDEHVAQLHQQLCVPWPTVIIPSGEASKSWDRMHYLIDELCRLQVDRSWFLVGVGGGVVTDLVGFLAAIYMRGLSFGFVPTTLLAQVDASIGGKNGIDFGKYKNLIGTIRQPAFVVIDPALLQTLPLQEWQNGFAEIIKYACIADRDLFDFLETHREQALQGEAETLFHVVLTSLQQKLHIVATDPYEKGVRRFLNFGHTLGHAIEKVIEIPHGQAISVGMRVACQLSQKLSGLKPTESERIQRLIQAYGLPTTLPDIDWNEVWDCLHHDKKREKDILHFILLETIGRARMEPIPIQQLEQLLPVYW